MNDLAIIICIIILGALVCFVCYKFVRQLMENDSLTRENERLLSADSMKEGIVNRMEKEIATRNAFIAHTQEELERSKKEIIALTARLARVGGPRSLFHPDLRGKGTKPSVVRSS